MTYCTETSSKFLYCSTFIVYNLIREEILLCVPNHVQIKCRSIENQVTCEKKIMIEKKINNMMYYFTHYSWAPLCHTLHTCKNLNFFYIWFNHLILNIFITHDLTRSLHMILNTHLHLILTTSVIWFFIFTHMISQHFLKKNQPPGWNFSTQHFFFKSTPRVKLFFKSCLLDFCILNFLQRCLVVRGSVLAFVFVLAFYNQR